MMNLELEGRIAIVTGASKGIGRGIAKVLAQEGAQTVVVARRAPLLEELAEEIVAEGGKRPLIVTDDLYERGAGERIVNATEAKFGRVDIVVNNAGGSRIFKLDADDEAWEEAFALNFTSLRKLAHAALPGMMARKWGRILCITGSLEPPVLNGANSAKAAVHGWAKGLSRDVAAAGVNVNCLMPGRIHSEQIDERLHPTAESREQFIKANIPIGHFGEPEDMAWIAAFLCSERARYITGQRMYVDGGMHRAL
jgi:3-oxoacyl-[acyl-carrier protein] reductase